jgi:hypothetical protein
VSLLATQASELMNAAESALREGNTVSDMTVVIGRHGGIRIIAGADWPLDSLNAHYGAKAAYRVTERSARIRVEGRGDTGTCLLETVTPRHAARLLLGGSGCVRSMISS